MVLAEWMKRCSVDLVPLRAKWRLGVTHRLEEDGTACGSHCYRPWKSILSMFVCLEGAEAMKAKSDRHASRMRTLSRQGHGPDRTWEVRGGEERGREWALVR